MNIKKNTPEVVLKEITPEDLGKVAAVHIDSFSESALTKLGAAIIERYYLWQLTGPHKNVRAVGAFVGGDCAGFSFSGVFDGSTAGFLDQNKSFLVKQVLLHPWLLFNSLFLKRLFSGVQILRRFANRKRITTERKPAKSLPYGILSIAVSTRYQNLGIGKVLMIDAEEEAAKCGFQQIELTVSPDNHKSIIFYEKLNWQKVPPDDSWKGYMIKGLK